MLWLWFAYQLGRWRENRSRRRTESPYWHVADLRRTRIMLVLFIACGLAVYLSQH
jgi:hypothetical protein